VTTDDLFAELAATRKARSEVFALSDDRIGSEMAAHAVGVFDAEIDRLRLEIHARLTAQAARKANEHAERLNDGR
jgi:hypothetical protein